MTQDPVPERLPLREDGSAESLSLEVMNEVARIATLDLELRPMLQRITDTLAAKFGWELVALVSLDLERQVFECEAVTSTIPTVVFPGYSRSLGSGVVGEVAAHGRPVLIDDVQSWPNYVETTPGARSELCVPVKHHGRVVAVLNLESTRPAAFQRQLELLERVADQLSGAIANAQMFEELRRRAELMAMMGEVTRTALDATDLQQLLVRVARFIHERFPLEVASIVMYDAAHGEFVNTTSAGTLAVAPAERWPVHRGVIGRCIRAGKTQLVSDVHADPEYVAVNDGVTSELVIPIRSHGEVLGVLNLESASPDAFRPSNVLAFEAFADQVGGAIRLASLNERLAETTRLLESKTQTLEETNAHLARAIETLERISAQDGLTGVANRRHFDYTLDLEWRRAARHGGPLSLLMVDIDHFKAFNDAAGHQAGDDCLRRVAQTLQQSLHRAGDLLARYGGEEFAVLLPETEGEHARATASHLRDRIEDLAIEHPASPLGHVTISVGVASLIPSRDRSDPRDLVRIADDALYEAKRAGRNCVSG